MHWRTRRSFSAPSLTIKYFTFTFVWFPVQSPRLTPTLVYEKAGRFFVRHSVFCTLQLPVLFTSSLKGKFISFFKFYLQRGGGYFEVSEIYNYDVQNIIIIIIIIIIIGIQPLGRSGQRPQLSQATGMAFVRCILGKFLGVACHCFPPLFRCSHFSPIFCIYDCLHSIIII